VLRRFWNTANVPPTTTWYLAYGVLVLLHAVLGWPMRQPVIFADELGYLGHARFLADAGPMPDMGTTTYYHFGYSLFLIPAFRLFSNPTHVYLAAIVTNAFLISVLFFAVVFVLQHSLRQPHRTAVAVAFVTCLYPAFILQSNFAWAENALIPAYACFIAAFSTVVRRYSLARVLALGALTAFLYTIHPRALPLLPVTALTLCALSVRQIVPWRGTIAAVLIIMLGFAVTDGMNDWLRSVGWSPRRSSVSVSAFLARGASPARIVNTMLSISGQVLYLAQSTYGLFPVPLLWIGSVLWKDGARAVVGRHERHAVLTVAFVFLCSTVLLGVSGLATSSGGNRADHLIYGRYNEVFLPHHLAFALVVLARARDGWWRTAVPLLVITIIGLLTGVVLWTRGDLLASRGFVAPNIFGIYPLVRALGRIDLAAVSLISAIIFVVLYLALVRRWGIGLMTLGAVFVAGSLYGYGYSLAAQDVADRVDDVTSRIRALGDVPAVSYDVRLFEGSSKPFYSSQYLLPRTRVRRFGGRRGETPPVPLVISTRTWPDAERLRARLVISERRSDVALWMLPGADQYESATRSYLGARLGWREFPGIWESGFHRREKGRAGFFRWTAGNARLVVPVAGHMPPTKLEVDLVPSTRTALELRVNDVVLFSGPAWRNGRRTFSLTKVPSHDWMTIELLSDTVVPRDTTPGSHDTRRLGVAVRAIQLLP
jgi:hypothetical protein